MNYICLVLVEFINGGKRYLFKAPAWVDLKAGDSVMVEDTKDIATVLDAVTVGEGSDVYNMILDSARAKTLKKVVQKIIYSDFVYDDDEGSEKHE